PGKSTSYSCSTTRASDARSSGASSSSEFSARSIPAHARPIGVSWFALLLDREVEWPLEFAELERVLRPETLLELESLCPAPAISSSVKTRFAGAAFLSLFCRARRAASANDGSCGCAEAWACPCDWA